MSVTTISSRDFNQDISKVKKQSAYGPVLITDRGRPAHVLLSIEDYQKITSPQNNIVDLLAMPCDDDFDFEPAKLDKPLYHCVDLS